MASNVVVADEMFPDGAEASFMDIEEAQILARKDVSFDKYQYYI